MQNNKLKYPYNVKALSMGKTKTLSEFIAIHKEAMIKDIIGFADSNECTAIEALVYELLENEWYRRQDERYIKNMFVNWGVLLFGIGLVVGGIIAAILL